ncbi:MAG TPA: hypothetical protein VJ794_07525, partial [Gemmatimonadales bacterium]|nr:hypothetical protein [Gemmatimonadales bacterium]
DRSCRRSNEGPSFPRFPEATDAFILLDYNPGRWLVLGWVPDPIAAPVTTWAMVLEEEPRPGWTRLIERGRVRSPYRPLGLPESVARRLAPLAHTIMVRKHLRRLARRAEGEIHGSRLSPTSGTTVIGVPPPVEGVANSGPGDDSLRAAVGWQQRAGPHR